MKVIFVINSLKCQSGSERVACILANQFADHLGLTVTIANRDSEFSDSAYTLSERVNVVKISGSSLQFYRGLTQLVAEQQPDYLIAHNMGKLALLCALVSGVKRRVVLEHVSLISRPKIVQLLTRILYKKIDQVVTLTRKDADDFSKFHANVVVIPNFSPFPITARQCTGLNTIVTIGRLTDQKNYIHLLQAWQKIWRELPDWQLHIYGDGEQKAQLDEYITTHQIGNIHLCGVTSAVQQVYEQSDFFVMSSKYEGLPMVLIEAQSFGLPIVSYNCPHGPSDIIRDQYNGFLVENQNIDQLADKIRTLATTPDLLQKFSNHSLLNAEQYQPEKIMGLWVEYVLKG